MRSVTIQMPDNVEISEQDFAFARCSSPANLHHKHSLCAGAKGYITVSLKKRIVFVFKPSNICFVKYLQQLKYQL